MFFDDNTVCQILLRADANQAPTIRQVCKQWRRVVVDNFKYHHEIKNLSKMAKVMASDKFFYKLVMKNHMINQLGVY